MRLRKIPGALEFILQQDSVLNEQSASVYAGKWRQLFGAVQPLHLEIGMGRGKFITTAAAQHPETNYLGLDVREEVVMQAVQRLDTTLPNLRFLYFDAALLGTLFAPGELDRIYLHFPDPWPKSRHAKRRLTSLPKLQMYKQLLAADGAIYFKTDNHDLFSWSLENFQAAGFELTTLTEDLPLDQAGIQTEYELRYRRHNQPICFLIAQHGA